ncbi:ADL358Wp [Eremothecium gossypii ATCC 10895]|uniref:ADL358Wp n=1 Tax=Eremothecium gossypii (strain ATCC 10895 / CBS 109.51 / FGSC 9923 / NRRL Y-1056) TaxID=284811 RepID=Q75BC5_EREGS|nr:ADL358Wp [Eremothecium gossypii ATCC 10895]AAS51561.1 ADL358Wp [Eremothecium gossypii ATCC 10895]AEY95857.1 FADL358Wp [Eremothecium gossypii FDAG1]
MFKQGTPGLGGEATSAHNEMEQLTSFQTVAPMPISVMREMSGSSGSKAGHVLQHALAGLTVYQNLPNGSIVGVDDLTRMKMALMSGVDEEVTWSLKKYLVYSNKAPYMVSLRMNRELVDTFNTFVVAMAPILEMFKWPLVEEDFYQFEKGLNAILILRNLAQDSDSTQVLAMNEPLKLFLLTVLEWCNLFNHPNHVMYQENAPLFMELINYVLDLVEAISSYIAPAKKDDPFFKNLVSILRVTNDRYHVISILRSLSRLLVRSKADQESAADNLDDEILNLIVSYLLVDCDNELVMASLDFLYQYILPGSERITTLLSNPERNSILTTVLPSLLTYNVELPDYDYLSKVEIKLVRRVKPRPPTHVPTLPPDLFQKLLGLNEPMRSTAWLRCCFESAADSEVTQISLWKSYEHIFSEPVKQSGRRLLPAVEFIKNVSNAFVGAAAMVVTDPVTAQKRFVIKGIQPRIKAVSINDGEAAASANAAVTPPTTMGNVTNAGDSANVKDVEDALKTAEAKQIVLPKLKFPTKLSDVSKASATFLCLLSNDTQGLGLKFCNSVKPSIMHTLADVPPLNAVLSEFMDNIPTL